MSLACHILLQYTINICMVNWIDYEVKLEVSVFSGAEVTASVVILASLYLVAVSIECILMRFDLQHLT